MKLITKTELADRLDVSRPTLDKMIEQYDNFPKITTGNSLRFDFEIVTEFLRELMINGE